MAGLNSKALNHNIPNNSKKFIAQTFDEELGALTYQFKFRNFDPQIGRFIEIDPLAEKYYYNSCYDYSENRVINGFDLEGLEFFGINSGLVGLALESNNIITRTPLGDLSRAAVEVSKRSSNEQMIESFRKGNITEKSQLQKLDLEKNNKPVELVDPKTGIKGKTVPDALKNDEQSTVEIKNVKTQNLTKQLRLQEKYSNDNGFSPELIINKDAKLSGPLLNSSYRIFRYVTVEPTDNTKVKINIQCQPNPSARKSNGLSFPAEMQ